MKLSFVPCTLNIHQLAFNWLSSLYLNNPITYLGSQRDNDPISRSKLKRFLEVHDPPVEMQLYVGWSFHVGAFKALKRGRANMDVLISGGSWASYIYSLISVFHRLKKHREGVNAEAKDYFETAALLITFLSLGKLLESVAKGKTSEVPMPA